MSGYSAIPGRPGFSYANAVSLTAVYSIIPVTVDVANSPLSSAVPGYCSLEDVTFSLSAIAGGPATMTFYLARDAAGDYPITPEGNSVIVLGDTTATLGGAAIIIDRKHLNPQEAGVDVAGSLYVVAKLAAGTATANVYLNWTA